jgi:hypothetical protein
VAALPKAIPSFQFYEVVNLTVVHQANLAIFAEHWLSTVAGEIDDGETATDQSDIIVEPDSAVIRTAVGNRRAHALEQTAIQRCFSQPHHPA